MRFRSLKALALVGLLLLTGVAAGATKAVEGLQLRYTVKPEELKAYTMAEKATELTQDMETLLNDGHAVRYIISGADDGNNGYTLNIQVQGLRALGGRIALGFDSEKLQVDSEFTMAPTFRSQAEMSGPALDETDWHDMISQDAGYACLSWYYNSTAVLEARETAQNVATLHFTYQEDMAAKDIDSSTFYLLPLEEGDMQPYTSAATLWGKSAPDTDLPETYQYLDEMPCGVDFLYVGNDKTPETLYPVEFQCVDNLGQHLDGVLELNGRLYKVENGTFAMGVAPGRYQWRIQCDGYGVWEDTLTVENAGQLVLREFYTNETLVQEAAQTLEQNPDVIFQEGDTMEAVTHSLNLPATLAEGITVDWKSDNTGIIADTGVLLLAPEEDTDVTLTATISCDADESVQSVQKLITVKVLAKSPEEMPEPDTEPAEPAVPEMSGKPSTPAASAEPNAPTATTPSVEQPVFGDLSGFDWAEDAIYHLAQEGVIRGTSDTTFNPNGDITRGDYILILSRLLALENDGTAEAFSDVPADSYYYDAIMAARAVGIAQGDGTGRFQPKAPITRQDMITLTMRAMEKTGYLSSTNESADLSKFRDSDKIAAYALDNMKKAVGNGLILGDDNQMLTPLAKSTRAQAAVFVERILNTHNG